MSNRQDDLIEHLRQLGAERAGGCTGESNYDPELLAAMYDAADAIASLQARLDAAEKDAARLDSGRIMISGRDEFGEPTTVIHCGMNLRSAIDAAAEGV